MPGPQESERIANHALNIMWNVTSGAAELGAPLGAPERSADTGIDSQPFERATIELHPENPPPCHIVAIPR